MRRRGRPPKQRGLPVVKDGKEVDREGDGAGRELNLVEVSMEERMDEMRDECDLTLNLMAPGSASSGNYFTERNDFQRLILEFYDGLLGSSCSSVEGLDAACVEEGRGILQGVLQEVGLCPRCYDWAYLRQWILKTERGTSVRARKSRQLFAAVMYSIWMERNARIFRGEAREVAVIIRALRSC
ncbi:hypothetical protein Dimus_033307 [Dionaea muscipula]